MSAKLVKCKVCGTDMAANAKACPQCGAKNKKPIYKRWWVWLIVVFIAIGAAGGDSDKSTTPQKETAAVVSTQQEQPAKTENESAERPAEAESEPVETPTETPAEAEVAEASYTHYDVTELFDVLSGNALKAEKMFQDQYVEIEGYLSNIDSDGSYISVGADPDDYEYFLQSIQCFLKKNEVLLDQIIEMNVGDPIVVRGKITNIGEVLGYQMNLDSIN